MGGTIKILDAKKGEKPIENPPPKEEDNSWRDQHVKKLLKIVQSTDLYGDGFQPGVYFDGEYSKQVINLLTQHP